MYFTRWQRLQAAGIQQHRIERTQTVISQRDRRIPQDTTATDLDSRVPVSYTHLDVYKRQVMLRLDFEPQSRLLGPALAIGMQGLADRMVDDFVREADKVSR